MFKKDVMETAPRCLYCGDRDGEETRFPSSGDQVLDVDVEKYHDCTFDERACLNELSCKIPHYRNDGERNEHKYTGRAIKGTAITEAINIRDLHSISTRVSR